MAISLDKIRWADTSFLQSVADVQQFPEIDLPKLAVAGHSNVGKSTLLNTLFGRRGLVRTSKSPGCTQLLNLFEVNEQLLIVDLPGYGYARASKKAQAQWTKLIEAWLSQENGLALVLMLMDIRHGPKPADLDLIAWLNAHGLRWHPIATKADKLSGNKRAKRLREMTVAMGGMLSPLPVSSLDKRGIEELRQLIVQEVLP